MNRTGAPDERPPGPDEFERRHRACARERSIVAAVGYTPFLLLYVLVHTKYLRPYMPESKNATAAVLVLIPGAWLGCLILLQRWLGPIRHRLTCPRCGQALVGDAFRAASESGNCSRCGTMVVQYPSPSEPAASIGRARRPLS